VRYILVIERGDEPRVPRRGKVRGERTMRTLTTMIEWSAVAIAVYAAIAFATSGPALTSFA